MRSSILFFILILTPLMASKNQFGASQDFFPDEKVRELADAAAQGEVKKLERLIKQSKVSPNAEGVRGVTPLLWAAYSENRAGFDALLAFGANINYVNKFGTPLISYFGEGWAYDKEPGNDTYYIEKLLSLGADVNAEDPATGWTVLMHACSATSSLKKIEILIKYKVNINQLSVKFGDYALMHCIRLFQFDKILLLLENGADFNLKTKRGITFVDLMKRELDPSGFPERDKARSKVIEFLKKKGVSLR